MQTKQRDIELVLDSIEEADAKIADMIVTMRFAAEALNSGANKNGQTETWTRGLLGVLIEAAENARAALGDLGFNAVEVGCP